MNNQKSRLRNESGIFLCNKVIIVFWIKVNWVFLKFRVFIEKAKISLLDISTTLLQRTRTNQILLFYLSNHLYGIRNHLKVI
ncbi:MAG: hypothetical protein ACI9AU_000755 [Bacteroidia bacterium]|jgi:hypothetical protein